MVTAGSLLVVGKVNGVPEMLLFTVEDSIFLLQFQLVAASSLFSKGRELETAGSVSSESTSRHLMGMHLEAARLTKLSSGLFNPMDICNWIYGN